MCNRHHPDSIGDWNLDEPDYNDYEDRRYPDEEPDRDEPTDLLDTLYLIGTGKTLREWNQHESWCGRLKGYACTCKSLKEKREMQEKEHK